MARGACNLKLVDLFYQISSQLSEFSGELSEFLGQTFVSNHLIANISFVHFF